MSMIEQRRMVIALDNACLNYLEVGIRRCRRQIDGDPLDSVDIMRNAFKENLVAKFREVLASYDGELAEMRAIAEEQDDILTWGIYRATALLKEEKKAGIL